MAYLDVERPGGVPLWHSRGKLKSYDDKNKLLAQISLGEVSPIEFYDDIFPIREHKGDTTTSCSNPIICYKVRQKEPFMGYHFMDTDKPFFRTEIMFSGQDGLDTLERAQKSDFALCGLCSYYGKARRSTNAYKLHGMCIDLDGVAERQLYNLWYLCTDTCVLPLPTYIVNSGKGLHLYYVFEEPIPLYPNIRPFLAQLYRNMEDLLVYENTSYIPREKRQGYLSIYQTFRMVGSVNGKYDVILRAYKTGKRVSLSYLNDFLPEKHRIPIFNDISEYSWSENHISLEEAKRLYPNWYQRKIVEGKPSLQWVCNKGLYDWWFEKLQSGIHVGNRYFCIGILYAFAIKCNIPIDEVREDAMGLLPILKTHDVEDNAFTEDDILAAEHYYSSDSARMSIRYIEAKTGIRIPRNKRNGRSREDHIKRVNALNKFDQIDGKGAYTNNGRKPQKDVVRQWRLEHPDGKKAQCIKDTGLSKPTVYKWWDQ